jgi:hypothetical protein
MWEYIKTSVVADQEKQAGLQMLSTSLPLNDDFAPVFEVPRIFQEKNAIREEQADVPEGKAKVREASHKSIIETFELIKDSWNNRRQLERLCCGIVPIIVAGTSPTCKTPRPFRAVSTMAAILGVWPLLLEPVAGEFWAEDRTGKCGRAKAIGWGGGAEGAAGITGMPMTVVCGALERTATGLRDLTPSVM